MYTTKQARAIEYCSRLKDGTYKIKGDEGLLSIKLGWFQYIHIFKDDTLEGAVYHLNWNDTDEFEDYVHGVTLMKNLLYYIENGHNEVTT